MTCPLHHTELSGPINGDADRCTAGHWVTGRELVIFHGAPVVIDGATSLEAPLYMIAGVW